jgi:hypothetical protein
LKFSERIWLVWQISLRRVAEAKPAVPVRQRLIDFQHGEGAVSTEKALCLGRTTVG